MNVLLVYCDVGSPARYLRFLEVGGYHQVLHEARIGVQSLLVEELADDSAVAEAFRRQPAQLVCFYIGEFNLAASLDHAAKFKATFPDTPLCAIGIFPALAPDRITGAGLFEYMVVGEGEFALYELATQLQARADVGALKNLWWNDNGTWNRNPLRPLLEQLDQLPYPDRSLFRQELLTVPASNRVLTVTASRGCMYDCQFCYSPVLKRAYGGKGTYYRVRSPQHVAGEVLAELRHGDYARVVFVDEQFPTDKAWLRGLAQRLGTVGVRFQATVSIERCDAEVLDLLREAGCESIQLGIETGNEAYRKRIADRNLGNEKLLQFAAMVRDRGIRLITTNLSGLPLESEQLQQETATLNQQLDPTEVRTTAYVPIEKTPLHGYALDKHYIDSNWLPVGEAFSNPQLELPELPGAKQKAHLTRMHFLNIVQRMKGLPQGDALIDFLRELPRAKLKMTRPGSIDVRVNHNPPPAFGYLVVRAGAECRFPVDLPTGAMLRFRISVPQASFYRIQKAGCRLLAEVQWTMGESTETLYSRAFSGDDVFATQKWRECMVPGPDTGGAGEIKFRVLTFPEADLDVQVLFGSPRVLDPRSQRRRATDGDGEMQLGTGPQTGELQRQLDNALREAEVARSEREQKLKRIAELQERILELENLLNSKEPAEAKDAGLGDKLKGMFRK